MNRQIKFRAWNPDDKTMWYMNDLESDQLPNEELSVFLDDNYGCELLQYTGLKDKNGKEIYEGDIVGFTFFEYGITEREVYKKGVIEFDGLSFLFTTFSGETYTMSDLNFDSQTDIEVIGNRFENPELLNS